MPGGCHPSVTVHVEIRAGVIWAAYRAACRPAFYDVRHAGMHAARHFLFLESY